MISRYLAPHRICAFASPEYLRRRGTPQHPDELVGHECVNFRYQSTGQAARWPFRLGDKVLEIAPDAGITIDVSDAVAATLVASGGIGISATYIAAPFVERGELVPLMYELAHDLFPLTALWPESRRGNPNVKPSLRFSARFFLLQRLGINTSLRWRVRRSQPDNLHWALCVEPLLAALMRTESATCQP